MKAIKIDVVNKTITEIEISSNYKEIYKVLDCDCFTCIVPDNLPKGDTLYIDDEGLLRTEFLGAFYIKGFAQVLSGHGLILGTDIKGNSTDVKSDLETIKKLIRFEDTHYLPKPGFTITNF